MGREDINIAGVGPFCGHDLFVERRHWYSWDIVGVGPFCGHDLLHWDIFYTQQITSSILNNAMLTLKLRDFLQFQSGWK